MKAISTKMMILTKYVVTIVSLLVLFPSAFVPAASAYRPVNTKLLYVPEAVYTYDDADPAFTYHGTWTAVTNYPNTMNGTLHWTQTAGSYAMLNFTGSTVSYFYSIASNRGNADILIGPDSNHLVLVDTLDLYASETRRQIGKTWTLSPGNHTIEIVAWGNGFIDLDAIAIDIVSVGIGGHDDRDSLMRYAGAWTVSGAGIIGGK